MKRLTLTVALIAMALGWTAANARAAQMVKGYFDLPEAAYWGDTLLQPGHYTISMNTELHTMPVINVDGEGTRASFLTMSRPVKVTDNSFLTISDVNGTYVIRDFDAGFLGRAYAFSVTKNVKKHALRASARPDLTLPVSSGAGF